jgi:hypothetical protein
VTQRNDWNDDNDLSDPNRDPSCTRSRHSSVDFEYPFPDQDFDEPSPPSGSPHPIPWVPLQPRALSPTPPPGDLDEDDYIRQIKETFDVLEVAGLLLLHPIPARTLVTANR